jgi:hypothetical protein
MKSDFCKLTHPLLSELSRSIHDEMGEIYSTQIRDHITTFSGAVKGRDKLEDLEVDGSNTCPPQHFFMEWCVIN